MSAARSPQWVVVVMQLAQGATVIRLAAPTGAQASERAERFLSDGGRIRGFRTLAVFTEAEWGKGERRMFDDIAVIVTSVPVGAS